MHEKIIQEFTASKDLLFNTEFGSNPVFIKLE